MRYVIISTETDGDPRITLDAFTEANAEHTDMIASVAALDVGGTYEEGGGAAPRFCILRIPDDASDDEALRWWAAHVVRTLDQELARLTRMCLVGIPALRIPPFDKTERARAARSFQREAAAYADQLDAYASHVAVRIAYNAVLQMRAR